MAKKGTLTVRVVSDTKAAEQGLDRFSTKVSSTGDKLQTAGKKMTMFATVPIAAAMGVATKAASDLNETLSKSNTVFSSSAKEVENWADGAADSFGQSKREALDAASTFGNLFVQLGVGAGEAAKMSMEMTELASDFASFHNADITEVINAQSAAFRGEYDALQRFVPTINAAAVEQEALAQTGKKVTSELTAQEKALAVQTLMLEGAGDAMGDFDRTSESAANQARKATAAMEDASAEIGQALLPLAAKLAGGIADLAKAFGDLPKPIQNGILALSGIVAVAGPVTTATGTIIKGAEKASDVFETLRLRTMYLKDALGGGAGLTATMGAAGAVLTVGAVLYGEYSKTKSEAARITDLLTEAMGSENAALETNSALLDELSLKDYAKDIRDAEVDFDVLTDAIRNNESAIESLDDDLPALANGMLSIEEAIDRAGLSGTDFGDALIKLKGEMSAGAFADFLSDLDGLADRHGEAARAAEEQAAQTDYLAGKTNAWHDKIKESHGITADAIGGLGALGDAAGDAADEEVELKDAIKGVNDALKAQFDPLFAAQDALYKNQDAQQAVEDATLKALHAQLHLNATIKTYGEDSPEAAEAAFDLAEANREVDDANREAARSAIDVTTATHELAAKMKAGEVDINSARRQIKAWADQGLITEEQARDMRVELDLVAVTAHNLDGQQATVRVDADTLPFWLKWLQVASALGSDKQFMPQIGPDGRFVQRHTGGPGHAGYPYLVGRPGAEELFVPTESGTFLSGADTDRALSRTTSGGGDMTLAVLSTLKSIERKIERTTVSLDGHAVGTMTRREADFHALRNAV